jgi:hypothetical protein
MFSGRHSFSRAAKSPNQHWLYKGEKTRFWVAQRCDRAFFFFPGLYTP